MTSPVDVRLWLWIGRWASFTAPVAGLAVFWLLPFKPAVTLYALIVALAMALQPVIGEARVRREIREIFGRQVDEYDAR